MFEQIEQRINSTQHQYLKQIEESFREEEENDERLSNLGTSPSSQLKMKVQGLSERYT